jgi:hypothetical protein
MILSCVRVSTNAQDLACQLDGLRAANCERVFREEIKRCDVYGETLRSVGRSCDVNAQTISRLQAHV